MGQLPCMAMVGNVKLHGADLFAQAAGAAR